MNLKNILINKKATIRDAIKTINKNSSKSAIIVDSNNKIIGLLSDGDIRRAIIKNIKLNSKAITIATKDPFVVPSNISLNKIKEIMKSNGLFQIPVVDKNKKLIGLHDWNSINKSQFKISNHFLIMAGGFGKRLLPLTKKYPKPMLKIGNIRIIDRIIQNAKNYGFEKFIISTHYLSKKIKDFCGDGNRWGVKISYIDEKKPLGTAGCLYFLKNKLKNPLFITNGDVLTSLDFQEMVKSHYLNNADFTVAVQMNDIKIPFSVVKTQGLEIKKIIEKPVLSNYVNAGIYVISPNILKLLKTKKKIDMPDLIQVCINQKKKVFAFPLHENWEDVGQSIEQVRL